MHIARETGARAALRAHVRRHQAGAPRRLAAERAALVQRRGQAHRLRAGVVDAEDGEDRAGDHLRQGQLHVARAGARREARRRAPICTPAGIILWELLTGRQLFPSGARRARPRTHTSEELLRRVRDPEVIAPSKRARRVPAELDRIAMKALAPDLEGALRELRGAAPRLATFLAQTAPAMDSARVAKFLSELYDDDIEGERAEREQLHRQGARVVHRRSAARPRPPSPGDAAQHDGRRLGPPAARANKSRRPQPRDGVRAERRPLTRARAARQGARQAQHEAPRPRRRRGHVDSELGRAAEPGPSAVGTVIGGRYFVRRLSGEGGMGRVYEAEHTDIGRRVALKILHPRVQPDARSGRAPAPRGARGVADLAPQHGRRHRLRHDARRRVLLRHGVPRGAELARAHLATRATLAVAARAAHRRARSAARCRRRTRRRHPPRPQARERLPPRARRQTRLRQGARLRHRQDRRWTSREREGPRRQDAAPAHAPGHDDGDARVHGARAGRGAAGRPALGRLRGRRDAVRDALGEAALRGEELHGDPPQEGEHCRRRSRAAAGHAARARGAHHAHARRGSAVTAAVDGGARPPAARRRRHRLSRGSADHLAFFERARSGSSSTGQLAQPPVTAASSSALTRLRLVERKEVAYAAGGLALPRDRPAGQLATIARAPRPRGGRRRAAAPG